MGLVCWTVLRRQTDESNLMPKTFPGGISLEDVEDGLLIRQNDVGYVARNWKLTPQIEELVETAVSNGFGCMIRETHPRRDAHWPNPKGVVYIAFSPGPELHWSFVIDDQCHGRDGGYRRAAFSGKYRNQFDAKSIPYELEKRNKQSGHFLIDGGRVLPTIEALRKFDHSVLIHSNNRKFDTSDGFQTEYDIQHMVLTNWDQTPWASKYQILESEFRVENSRTSRRIDVLARARVSHGIAKDTLIIELKRGEANLAAVEQVASYARDLGRRDEFAHGRIDPVLVAERIPPNLHALAISEGVAAYEVRWPMEFRRVI